MKTVVIHLGLSEYLSGDLMIVDYGSSLEVEAGIRPNAMGFTFDTILQKMAAMLQQ